MGWTWSLYFAQALHEFNVIQSGLNSQHRIIDRSPSVPLAQGSGIRHAVYVDNNLIVGHDTQEVHKASTQLQNQLNSQLLPVHDIVDASTEIEFVGLTFNGSTHEIRISWKRLWRIRLAIFHIFCISKITGRDLEKVLGHITWALLLRREMLSILNASYSVIRQCYDKASFLWPSVLRELRQIVSLLPLICTNTSLPWDPITTVSDASDEGFAVLERNVGSDICGKRGRNSERWRYDYEDSAAARRHALGDPTFLDPGTLTRFDNTVPPLAGDGFEEVDRQMLHERDWSFVYAGKWKRKENILRTESRGLIWGIKHKFRNISNFNKRHVFLVDNLALALACTRGRAGSPNLSGALRTICAYSLATGSKLVVRWVPSEYNPSDRRSRDVFDLQNRHGSPPDDFGSLDFGDNRRHSEDLEKPTSDEVKPNESPDISDEASSHGSPSQSSPSSSRCRADSQTLVHHSGFAGAERNQPIHDSYIRTRTKRPHQLDEADEFKLQFPRGMRRICQTVFQPPDDQFDSPRSGRQDFSSPGSCQSPSGERTGYSFPKQHQMPDRLAAPDAREFSSTIGLSQPYGHLLRDVFDATDTPGPLPARGVQRLPSTVVSYRDVGEKPGKANTSSRGHLQPLDHQSFSTGGPRCQQNEDIRRCHHSRLDVDGRVDRPVLSSTNFRSMPRGSLVAFQPCRPPPGLSEGRSADWIVSRTPFAIHTSTRRGLARQPVQTSHANNDQRSRTVELGRDTQKVHASKRGAKTTFTAAPKNPPTGKVDRSKFGTGNELPRHSDARNSADHRKTSDQLNQMLHRERRKRRFGRRGIFLELFSGCNSLSNALRAAGFAVLSFDILQGPNFDITRSVVLQTIKNWIFKGLIIGCWLGTPCTTWSCACNPAFPIHQTSLGLTFCSAPPAR